MQDWLAVLFSDEMLVVWQVLGSLLGTLIITAVTLWVGTQTIRQARQLWSAVRGQTGALLGAVDEPTDAALRALAEATRIPATVWAAVLPAFVMALAAGLDRATGIDPAGGE